MPPVKVFVFIGSLGFLVLVGFLLWEPSENNQRDCLPGELHSHDGGPLHCD